MANNSIQDLKSKKMWLALAAEFIGTLLLVLVACGSCGRFRVEVQEFTNVTDPDSLVVVKKFIPNDLVQISLCFGLSVATIVWSIAHVSGGHINPGVTIGFFVTRKISFVKAILYMASQTVGALVGALLLKALTPSGVNDGLGSTLLGENVSVGQGLAIEAFITFVLVWTVFATCDSNRTGLTGSGPLAIGLSIAMCHLWAIPYTGSGMNPARAFGSHAISGNLFEYSYTWLYWIGPLFGGAIAALLYELLFAANSGAAKLGGFLRSDYDSEYYGPNGRKNIGNIDPNLTDMSYKEAV